MNSWKATIFIVVLFHVSLTSVFGDREKCQSCGATDISRILREVGMDCNRTIGDFGDTVRLPGTISTSRVTEFAEKICTKTCGKRLLDFSRDNNCSLGSVYQQITNVEALCSMNLDNKACIQVYDEAPPVFTNSSCTSVATCPPHCLTEANNFKCRLGCCFGTLLRTPTSYSLLATH